MGTHNQLMSFDGAYAALVRKQQVTGSEDGEMGAGENDDRNIEGKLDAFKEEVTGFDADASSSVAPNMIFSPDSLGRNILTLSQTLRFITHMNREETGLLVVGLFCAIISGFGVPSMFPSLALELINVSTDSLLFSPSYWMVFPYLRQSTTSSEVGLIFGAGCIS